ncbi:MAG: DNA repair protein RecN [Oscillospiraceae bacterium]|jgi:DNA repair protein RecN (Recombination protein N)|nr:DNA repair protein RecN [Oscillospiraceae bacterium]
MLTLLHIENIAVIEQADITFDAGLNLLTGETGAGKSIVLDALGAVIGLRTSRDLVRTGAKTARVSAVFAAPPAAALALLRDNGIETDGAEELLVSREVSADGRNVCRVCGRPATVALLRQLGAHLLQIHGQHDSHALLDEDNHLPLLDRFAGLDEARVFYRRAYDLWKDCQRRQKALHLDEAEKTRRVETLQFACREIEEAALEAGEDDELLARREVLRNADRLNEAVQSAAALLLGDEETDGAVRQFSQAARALADVAPLHTGLAALHERLEELHYTADDLASDLSAALSDLDVSPGELDALEARLDLIYRLKRKYGPTVEAILTYGEDCRAELDALDMSERALAQLETETAVALEKARSRAAELSAARGKAAVRLAQNVREELSALNMEKAVFQVELRAREGEPALGENGGEEARFLLSANLGEALKPLSRIASGGELSRIMLALCNVLAQGEEAGTMVFDEIDAGVSGRAAGRVAEKLARLSRDRQVLCVTHLPQIAAMADTHFRIVKGVTGDRTVTNVDCLNHDGRVDELSRLIGGLTVTATTKTGAAEQLSAADSFKETLGKIKGGSL